MRESFNFRSEVETRVQDEYEDLYRFAYRLMQDPQGAQDLTQETVCKVLEGADQLTHAKNLSGWIKQVMINTARDAWRKKTELPDLTNGSFSRSSGDPSFVKKLEDQDLMGNIFSKLDKLGPEAKEIFELKGQDISFKEIAELQGITVEGAKTRDFRMRQALLNDSDLGPSIKDICDLNRDRTKMRSKLTRSSGYVSDQDFQDSYGL